MRYQLYYSIYLDNEPMTEQLVKLPEAYTAAMAIQHALAQGYKLLAEVDCPFDVYVWAYDENDPVHLDTVVSFDRYTFTE